MKNRASNRFIRHAYLSICSETCIDRFALNVSLEEEYLRNKFEGPRVWSCLFPFKKRVEVGNGRLALAKILGTRGNKRWF